MKNKELIELLSGYPPDYEITSWYETPVGCVFNLFPMEDGVATHLPHTVKLSRRNLLALLHKLEMPGSRRQIVKPDLTTVIVEPDEEHYGGRHPGPMHPETEAFIQDLQAFLDGRRNKENV